MVVELSPADIQALIERQSQMLQIIEADRERLKSLERKVTELEGNKKGLDEPQSSRI